MGLTEWRSLLTDCRLGLASAATLTLLFCIFPNPTTQILTPTLAPIPTLALTECSIIDADFTKRDATICFFWSLPITSDEIKRRIWMLNMRFVDFLEVSQLEQVGSRTRKLGTRRWKQC